MKAETKEINNILYVSEIAQPPRTIPPVECQCGCGHTFQPRRRDQIYLNKQHADFGYNHNKRKQKHWKRKEIEKILMSNDRILEKHYKAERHEKCVTRYYEVLKADGFNFAYVIGKIEKDNREYYCLYNYCYYIYFLDKNKMIQIYKL